MQSGWSDLSDETFVVNRKRAHARIKFVNKNTSVLKFLSRNELRNSYSVNQLKVFCTSSSSALECSLDSYSYSGNTSGSVGSVAGSNPAGIVRSWSFR